MAGGAFGEVQDLFARSSYGIVYGCKGCFRGGFNRETMQVFWNNELADESCLLCMV